MTIAAAEGDALPVSAAGALVEGRAEGAGAAERHALEQTLLALGQVRMRGEQAGQEVTHDGAKIQPGFTGREPPAGRAHG